MSEQLHTAMRAWGRQQALLMRETARFFMELDLTMAQFRALAVIRHAGRLTGRDLAAQLHVTPGTLVPLCDRLEELGYLRRVPDQEDRRLTWFEITSKGDRLFHRLWSAGGHRVMEAIARLEPDEQMMFARLLERITEHAERHFKAARGSHERRDGRRQPIVRARPAGGDRALQHAPVH